jgi:hypothetical protein
MRQLPSRASYVTWLDCDILFRDPKWLITCADRITSVTPFAQPFEQILLISPKDTLTGSPISKVSFGSVLARNPSAVEAGTFNAHGHTGFAWMARSDVVRACGLYDRCIAGGGDHVMAHAMTGTATSACVKQQLVEGSPLHKDFLSWSAALAWSNARSVTYTPGSAYHLWHGDRTNRHYADRNRELFRLGFDPKEDISINPDGAWTIVEGRPDLKVWASDYFRRRAEDD